MSYYRGNNEQCPHCHITYGELKTGFTFKEVYHMIYTRPYKRRRGVLGAWYELKQSLWEYHTEHGGCPEDPRNVEACAIGDIPF